MFYTQGSRTELLAIMRELGKVEVPCSVFAVPHQQAGACQSAAFIPAEQPLSQPAVSTSALLEWACVCCSLVIPFFPNHYMLPHMAEL